MATSWAALKGVALADICAAASWSTPCTFARFYRINVTSTAVGATVLMTAAKQTSEGGDPRFLATHLVLVIRSKTVVTVREVQIDRKL